MKAWNQLTETAVRLLAGMVLFVLSPCVFSQDESDQGVGAAEQDTVLEHVVVTGYHIKRIDFEGPAPVVVFDRESFDQSGINTQEEFARYLPINLPEGIRQNGAVGATGYDLRGIGLDATLVLVNGFRIAPYAQLAENSVDINSIPISAIERIEILKDGASAIYGADAIAGVVNIILRQNFNGAEANVGYGISGQGDGREVLADFIAGKENSHGSIMFSLSWYDREPQEMRDRNWSDDADFSSEGGPNFRVSHSSPPTLIRYDNHMFEADSDCGADPSVSSPGDSPRGPSGGTACTYNWPSATGLLWGIERVGSSLSGRYEFNPGLSFFGDLLYSKVEGESHRAPPPIGDSTLVETTYHLPFVPEDHPGNTFGIGGELITRPLEVGNRIHINNSLAYRLLLGLEGKWGSWDWQLSGLASSNKVEKTFHNMVSYDRFQLAMLGMGGPEGNLWYNPFGYLPQNDQAIIDWLRTTASLEDRSGEYSGDLLLSRMFGSLPGGQAGIAIGLQYREQTLKQWADDQLLSGVLGPRHIPVSAQREIASVYAELSLPLLDSLEAQLALRYEHYSDFGSTTNPKLALRWQPIDSLMFRASYSTSFKPPSFYELYAPVIPGWRWYEDTVRCKYLDPGEDCWIQASLEESGNPNLDAEKGYSWFAGMVWEPGFLPGFEFQADFWKFTHEDRIEWPGAQVVLDQGGDFGIIREPEGPDGTPGRIILVRETYVNTEKLETQGVDITMRYQWQSEHAGIFRLDLMHTYIDKWVITDTARLNIQDKNYAGKYRWDTALPRNRFNMNISWSRARHAVSANIHYTGSYENFTGLWVNGVETDERMIIADHATVDLQYSYEFKKLGGATLRLGCNNVTDKNPPLTYSPVNEPFHDARGRFWYFRWRQPIR